MSSSAPLYKSTAWLSASTQALSGLTASQSSSHDFLRGGLGNDTLNGGNGADRFVLARGEGTDIIEDFKNSTDKIGLTGRLTYDQLSFTQDGNRVKITVTATGEVLAYLNNFTLNQIDLSDFVTV